MIKIAVREYLCNHCPHNHYNGDNAKRVSGVYLPPGSRYCSGGQKPIRFGKRDPKQRVPAWCPLYLSPRTLRVYCRCSFYIYPKTQKPSDRIYLPIDYEIRYSGKTDLTARELLRRSKTEYLHQLLEIPVSEDEIIEVDDGLAPYFFVVGKNGQITSIIFDGKRARAIKKEHEE